jgi:hypothetical protein
MLMSLLACQTNFFGNLEIYATAVLFPITVTHGIRAIAPADFARTLFAWTFLLGDFARAGFGVRFRWCFGFP